MWIMRLEIDPFSGLQNICNSNLQSKRFFALRKAYLSPQRPGTQKGFTVSREPHSSVGRMKTGEPYLLISASNPFVAIHSIKSPHSIPNSVIITKLFKSSPMAATPIGRLPNAPIRIPCSK